MAQKKQTKTVAKAATKKTEIKPTKKATAKKIAPKAKMTAPVMSGVHECACNHDCKCHKCNGGCTFWRVMKKILIFIIIFAMGFAAAKFCPCNKHRMPMPQVDFVNGCVDAKSIKCPKLVAELPILDADKDGCVTRDEFKAVKKEMRRPPRVEFVNGCVDAKSVKCPKLVSALPAMDINGDGCVTRDEFNVVKKEMRREIREMRVELDD